MWRDFFKASYGSIHQSILQRQAFRSVRGNAICVLLFGGCFATQYLRNSHCDEEKVDSFSLYLYNDSRTIISNRLKKIGLSGEIKSNRVQFLSNASKRDFFVYCPLFAQRAAFRLKGLITTKDGDIIGVGRLSTLIGELKEESYEVAMPIVLKNSTASQEGALLDVPTRLNEHIHLGDTAHWVGHIPSGEVRGSFYPGMMFVRYNSLPIEEQIVVEGTICSAGCIDADGGCDYDHSKEELSDELRAELLDLVPERSDVNENKSSQLVPTDRIIEQEEEEEEECPVCRYIKKGPCKEEFLKFDKCMQGIEKEDDIISCAESTKNMMRCFLKYEYYDIMAAGFDVSKIE